MNIEIENGVGVFRGFIDSLEESTQYNVRLIVNAPNNSAETKFRFTTTGNTFVGYKTFYSQRDIDNFGKHQYRKLRGSISIRLPCGEVNDEQHCASDITNLEALNSIVEADEILIGINRSFGETSPLPVPSVSGSKPWNPLLAV